MAVPECPHRAQCADHCTDRRFASVATMFSGKKAPRVHVKAKTHFFKSLDLTELMVPADDTPGAFTGNSIDMYICLLVSPGIVLYELRWCG
jgi:hypothetical protein